jgi:hypothetical protein
MIWYAEDLGEEFLNVSVLCLTFANCAVLQYVFKFWLSYQFRFFHPRFSSIPSNHFAARKDGQAVIGENCVH